jgi:hypothetical protein
VSLFDGEAQRFTFSDEMLLPGEFSQVSRPDAICKRFHLCDGNIIEQRIEDEVLRNEISVDDARS